MRSVVSSQRNWCNHKNQIDFFQKCNIKAEVGEFSGRSHEQRTFPTCTYLLQSVPTRDIRHTYVQYDRTSCCICSEFPGRSSTPVLWFFWKVDHLQTGGADGWHVVIRPPVQSRTPSQCFLSSLIHLSSLKYHSQPHPRAWNYGNSPVMELLVINQYSWPQRWTHNINYYNSCAPFEE